MRRIVCILSIILAPLFLTACGDAETGMDVRKAAGERPDIDRSVVERGAMKIPGTESFNYTSYRSGQTGGGRGDSKPESRTGAVCRAEAADGSSAWGEFQFGYCFDNAGEAPLDAIVKLKVKVSETSLAKKKEGSGEGAPAVAAKATLSFFIKDSNGTVLRTENLLGNSVDKGPNSSGVSHDLAFDARFEPKRGYYLVMAGRSEVQAQEGQSATITLEIKEAALEIEWRPAAAAVAP